MVAITTKHADELLEGVLHRRDDARCERKSLCIPTAVDFTSSVSSITGGLEVRHMACGKPNLSKKHFLGYALVFQEGRGLNSTQQIIISQARSYSTCSGFALQSTPARI